MENGWIKLHRSLMQHWLYSHAELLRVWIDILLLASHREHKVLLGGSVVNVKRGSFIISKLQWAKRLKLSRPKLDRVLKMLKGDRMIEQQTCNQFTLISVVNYNRYQLSEEPNEAMGVTTDQQNPCKTDTTAEQGASSSRSPAVQPVCTIKKENNFKNDNNDQEVSSGSLDTNSIIIFYRWRLGLSGCSILST